MKNLPDTTSVKQEIEIQTLKRSARLEKIEDIFSFIVTKSTGVILLASGLFEIIFPNIITAVLPEPMGLAGVGLALVTGKKAAKKLLDALRTAID